MDTIAGGSIVEGTDVYGSDGDKVGSIVAVQPNYLVVEKGFFFPTDYYIPVSAVSGVQEGGVYLNVTKDAALNQGWDAVPADYDAATGTTTIAADSGRIASTSTDDTMAPGAIGGAMASVGDAMGTPATAAGTLAGAGTAGWDNTDTTRTERPANWDETATGRTDRTVGTDETISVPVREESLTATKTASELGSVRIEKDVISEEQTLSVPVTEERVRVERRVVDRPVGAADAGAFEDEVIEVPVYGEDVQLQKSVRVAEEVEIGKEAVTRDQQVAGTVRREEVRVVGDVVEGDTVRSSDTTVTGDVIEGDGPGGRREGGSATY